MSASVLSGLTPEQREAVLHRDGPLLILAGAGSGKTRVITRRVARLVESGVPREGIVAITFTNKAAREMRERVSALVPPIAAPGKKGAKKHAPGEVTIATFHSFAARFLRQHADRFGFGADFSILDEDDRLALVREAAIAARVSLERFAPPLLAHAIGRAKELLQDSPPTETDLERAAARVLPIYRSLARDRNALDFDDLVAETVRLLERDEEVRRETEKRIEHVLVDEYQDTNHAQYRLARLLAGERRNLAVCGDPDQSIYGWRGADLRNILRFEEDYEDAKVVRLDRNYRSTATILRAANALITRNVERKEKQLVPTLEEGGPIEVRRSLDEDYEADMVAACVEEAAGKGTRLSEIAVIYRANALARRYEDALLRRGIPFATTGSPSFFERREVKDALAYVRLAANPRDDLAALRAIKTPPRGLGARTLEKLQAFQRERGTSLLEACSLAGEVVGLSPHARTALAGFAELARDLANGASGPVGELVETALSRTELERHLAEADERGPERCANVRALLDAAREADRRTSRSAAEGGARGFLERLALLDCQDRDKEEDRERATLTTVHAAKGLEWDVVVVAGLEEGLFPHERSVEEGSLEEERRLAYVAFTRAKKKLVLSWSGLRSARAQSERRRPSTFLYELPRELLWDPDRNRIPELPERDEAPRPARPEKPSPLAQEPPAEEAAPAPRPWMRELTGSVSRAAARSRIL